MANVKLERVSEQDDLQAIRRTFNKNMDQLEFILLHLDSRNIDSLDQSKINQNV